MSNANPRYILRIITNRGALVIESTKRLPDVNQALPHAAGLALAWAKRSREYHGGYVRIFIESGEEIGRLPIVPPGGWP